jgi:two-component system response regulator NreC
MIKVALVDKHPVICDALAALLKDADDIEITGCNQTFDDLFKTIRTDPVHIVLSVLYNPDPSDIDNIKKLVQFFPRVKVLVLSLYNNEKFILRIIKAGAKGHLSRDTNRSEILEAIYTLRNGFEFYAKTITNILLNNYLDSQGNNAVEKEQRQQNLSPRELEVLKHFAEGMSNREIADKLFISIRTVETHKNNIMKKINLKTTVDLVKFALKNNIIELD